MKKQLSEKNLFGVRITTSSENDILEYVYALLKDSSKKLSIYTPNPEIIVRASKNPHYKEILNTGSILLPDGSGLIVGSWLVGSPLLYRITGVDFMGHMVQEILEKHPEYPLSVGFLGAKPNVALKAAECLQSVYPQVNVGFIGEEWEEGVFIPSHLQKMIAEKHFGNMKKLKEAITEESSGNRVRGKHAPSRDIDILFVAFGAPKQEEWIHEHLSHIPFRIAIGVGGAFDFITGEVSRAPWLIRLFGFEWLYRLVKEPWRWRRQLSLFTFMTLVVQEYLTLITSSFKKK